MPRTRCAVFVRVRCEWPVAAAARCRTAWRLRAGGWGLPASAACGWAGRAFPPESREPGDDVQQIIRSVYGMSRMGLWADMCGRIMKPAYGESMKCWGRYRIAPVQSLQGLMFGLAAQLRSVLRVQRKLACAPQHSALPPLFIRSGARTTAARSPLLAAFPNTTLAGGVIVNTTAADNVANRGFVFATAIRAAAWQQRSVRQRCAGVLSTARGAADAWHAREVR